MIGDFDDYPTTHDTPEAECDCDVCLHVWRPTTHDTPEAALAAALPNVPTIKYVIARGGRYNAAWWDRFAAEVLAAMPDWTLIENRVLFDSKNYPPAPWYAIENRRLKDELAAARLPRVATADWTGSTKRAAPDAELSPCPRCGSTDRWLHYRTCGMYYGGRELGFPPVALDGWCGHESLIAGYDANYHGAMQGWTEAKAEIARLRAALADAFKTMDAACRWAANETAGVRTVEDADRHTAGYDALVDGTARAGVAAGVLFPNALGPSEP